MLVPGKLSNGELFIKLESIRNILITRGHTDHIGCLHYCVGRNLQHVSNTWQIIMPDNCILPFKCITTAISSLNRGGYPNNFVDVDAEDTSFKTIKPFEKLRVDNLITSESCNDIPLVDKTNIFVIAYEMKHKIKGKN